MSQSLSKNKKLNKLSNKKSGKKPKSKLNKLPRKNQNLTLDFGNNKFERKLVFGGALLKNSHAKEKRPLSSKHPMHVVLRSSKATGEYSMLRSKYKKQIDMIIRKQAKLRGIKIIDMVNVGNHIHLFLRFRACNDTVLRKLFNGFIRAISGLIARLVLGVERGKGVPSQEATKTSVSGQEAEGADGSSKVTNGSRNVNEESSKVTNGSGKVNEEASKMTNGSRKANEEASKEINELSEVTRIKFWDQRPFTRIVEGYRAFLNLINYVIKNRLQLWGFVPSDLPCLTEEFQRAIRTRKFEFS